MPEDRAALLVSLRLEADADSLIAAWCLKAGKLTECGVEIRRLGSLIHEVTICATHFHHQDAEFVDLRKLLGLYACVCLCVC